MKVISLRYFYFFLGIIINSFGIAFITKSNLGTSQISSIPYIFSLEYTDFSFGLTTFISVSYTHLDIDIKKDSLVVLIQRNGVDIIPDGDTILEEKDTLVVFSQKNLFHLA